MLTLRVLQYFELKQKSQLMVEVMDSQLGNLGLIHAKSGMSHWKWHKRQLAKTPQMVYKVYLGFHGCSTRGGSSSPLYLSHVTGHLLKDIVVPPAAQFNAPLH